MSQTVGLSAHLSGWVVLCSTSILVGYLVHREKRISLALITGFGLRGLVAVFGYYVVPLPQSQSDAVDFVELASSLTSRGVIDIISSLTPGAYSYSRLLSLIFKQLGSSVLLGKSINVLIGTLTIYVVFISSRRLWSPNTATRAAWIVALYPSLILYSSITLREAPIQLSLALFAYYLIRWEQNKKTYLLLLSFGWFICASVLYSGFIVIIPLLVVLISIHLVINEFPTQKRLIQISCWIIVLAGMLLYSSGSAIEVRKLRFLPNHVSSASTVLEEVGRFSEQRMRGDLHFPAFLTVSYVSELWKLPLKSVYFLFTPFPWQVRSVQEVLGLLRSMLNVYIFYFFIASIPTLAFLRTTRLLLLMTITMFLSFLVIVMSPISSIRHSSKLIPLVVMLTHIPEPRLATRRLKIFKRGQ